MDDLLRAFWGELAHLQNRKLVHRALTSDNLLITDDDRAALLDLGGGEIAASDLAMRQLGTSGTILVASPKLIDQHAPPRTLEELKDWPTLSVANATEKFHWSFVSGDGTQVSCVHHPRLATDDLASLRMAAIQGLGIAELPRELVQLDLESGRLKHLLPELQSTIGIVHAVFPNSSRDFAEGNCERGQTIPRPVQ